MAIGRELRNNGISMIGGVVLGKLLISNPIDLLDHGNSGNIE